jgi:arylsulfatase A-like enzyme
MLGVLTPDKFAHAFGYDSELVREGIHDVDAAIARAEAIAEAGGWRDTLRVWVVGDHGHAVVSNHDDLHLWLESLGHRVLAHPNVNVRRPDMALMVGGNSMAHLYLNPEQRSRAEWSAHSSRWGRLLQSLVERQSVDLAAVTLNADRVRVFHAQRGVADIVRKRNGDDPRWTYCANEGDPLQLGGSLYDLDAEAAWEACAATDYPDAIVQLATLVPSPRSGDIVLSAAPDWDLRARYEPTPHVSTHGALHREQMMVPLLVDEPPTRMPQRTTDVVPSALDALELDAGPLRFEGRSFYRAEARGLSNGQSREATAKG